MSAEARIIECPCGFVLEGATPDEVVDAAQGHAREAHELELRCGDVVSGCPGVVTGATEDEILAQAAAHAAAEHGLTEIDDGTRSVLVGAIHSI